MKVGFVTTWKSLPVPVAQAVEKVLLKLKPVEAHHCNRADADRQFQSHAILQDVPVIKVQQSKRALVSEIQALIVAARASSDTTALIGQGRKLKRKIILINPVGDVIYES